MCPDLHVPEGGTNLVTLSPHELVRLLEPSQYTTEFNRFGCCTYALAGLQVDLSSSKRMLAQAEQVGVLRGWDNKTRRNGGVTYDLTHVG